MVSKIDQVENEIKKQLAFDQDNIYYIKLLAIIQFYILNNQKQANQLDAKIDEIVKKDISFDQSMDVQNASIINGTVVSIVASFKNKTGDIVSYSQRTPQFFGYDVKEFEDFTDIQQLMPLHIAQIHNNIIANFIEYGNSNSQTYLRQFKQNFGLDKNGFIFPIIIYINYYFVNPDDFCFSALMQKRTKNAYQYFIIMDKFGTI